MNKTLFALFLFLALALAGCTINPQDTSFVVKVPAPTNNQRPSIAPPTQSSSNPATQPTATPTPATNQITLTLVEVAKHNSANNCWMAINNQVLDLTSFLSHPGGGAYLPYCGTDATQAYNTKGGRGRPHSSYADQMFASYLVGTLGQTITR